MPHELAQDKAVRMYRTMVSLQTVDTIFYEAQRQVGQCFFFSFFSSFYSFK